MSDVLKPCPFCGGEAKLLNAMVGFIDWEASCENCGFSGPNFGAMEDHGSVVDYKDESTTHWNTRATPALTDPRVIALVDALEKLRLDAWGHEYAYESAFHAYVYDTITDALAQLKEPKP